MTVFGYFYRVSERKITSFSLTVSNEVLLLLTIQYLAGLPNDKLPRKKDLDEILNRATDAVELNPSGEL